MNGRRCVFVCIDEDWVSPGFLPKSVPRQTVALPRAEMAEQHPTDWATGQSPSPRSPDCRHFPLRYRFLSQRSRRQRSLSATFFTSWEIQVGQEAQLISRENAVEGDDPTQRVTSLTPLHSQILKNEGENQIVWSENSRSRPQEWRGF